MRVALVHDYLNQAGGAEKVVEVFCEMFPQAPVFTSVYDPDVMPDFWRQIHIETTFMQRISPKLAIAKRLLPLYPRAFESFDFSGYDLVVSSCSTFSKGVITAPETLHLCYCHNATRYAWMYNEYVAHESIGAIQRVLLPSLVSRMRIWDHAAAQRPDHFVANSRTTAQRIEKFYRRASTIIEPPIQTADFAGGDGSFEPYYLVLARLQSYKRIDLAVQAATRLGVRLRIVGRGPDESRLRDLAGPTVEFLGRVSDTDRVRLLQRCSALIVPGREDFGIASLEAQAAGRPVLAFAAGGSLETVIEGKTGTFFREQTVEGLQQLIAAFQPERFDAEECRRQADRFDVARFKERMFTQIDTLMTAHREYLQ